MGGPEQRLIFLLGFLAACAAFRLGYRRLRRVRAARTPWEALRLAFRLSLALLVAGCPAGAGGAGGATTSPTTTTDASGPGTGLGEEADAVWAELTALWDETGTFESGQVASGTLEAARGRADGLLARLGGLERVARDAPGLVALLRLEFLGRLDLMPADVDCYEAAAPRTTGGLAYERLAARIDALEELAARGYVNGWLRDEVLARLRTDVAAVRASIAEGDDWRTEDESLRRVDPAEVLAVLERLDAALGNLAGP
jgi:hypothetical protein